MARSFPSSATPLRARATQVSHPFAAGFRPAAAALAVALAFAAPVAPAQPVPAQVIHGTATFATSGSNLTVTTTNGVLPTGPTNHSAIDWTSFSIPAGSVTRFVQPSAASTSINRVIAPNPSQVLGQLGSNGKLVLVNPWGITVGAGAQVDTAGFTASTLAMTDADTLAGRLRFAGTGAPLQVDGTIRAQGGDIVLVAPQLQTGASAIVQADGAAILAAGQQVEITGRGLEGIVMQVQAGSTAVNLGTLQGDAVGIFAGTLKHSGLIQAQSVDASSGKVVLKAAGDALVDGSIAAKAADRGGSIAVLGDRVALRAGASLDASGAGGGGSVRIGGDAHGANPEVPNARATFVDGQATVSADATQQGVGGRIVVWSDELTRMRGALSARGGVKGGDGGLAEVSSRKDVQFTGRVDLRAPAGQAGTLLLDPNDIVISGSHATDTQNTGDVFSGGGDTAYVAAQDLAAQLALGNVQVSTSAGTSSTGHLTLASDASVQWTSGKTLTLTADNGISLAGQVNSTNTGYGSGSLVLSAANGSIAQAAGSSLRVGMLTAAAAKGDVLLDQPNHVEVLAGSSGDVGSQFVFHNAETLNVLSTGSAIGVNSAGAKLGATTIRTDAGALFAHAPIGGSSVTLQAGDTFDMSVDTLLIARTGKLSIQAGGTMMLAMQPGASTYGSASLNGATGVELTAAAIRSSSSWPASGPYPASTAGVSVYAGGGTGVSISAAGDVDLGPATTLSTWRAPVAVTSTGGSILGQAQVATMGSANGSVSVSAPRGSVSFSVVNSMGSYSAPQGGAVTLAAQGNVQGQSIWTDASYDGAALRGNGGAVAVTSTAGKVTLEGISSKGGTVSGAALQGGDGGTIAVHADRNIVVNGSVTAAGGTSSGGGMGGNGGSIELVSANGSIFAYGGLSATGADGSGSSGGGSGGSIRVLAQGTGAEAGNVMLGATTQFHGGHSWGGTAGNGGSFQVLADKGVQLASVEGWGGSAHDPVTPTLQATAATAATAAAVATQAPQGGKGGSVDISSANGAIHLGSVDAEVGTIAAWIKVYGGGGTSTAAAGDGGSIRLSATGANGAILQTAEADASGGSGYGGGSGGMVSMSAHGDINVSNVEAHAGYHASGATHDGVGGTAAIDSQVGDINAGWVGTNGPQGGPATIVAHQGSIALAGMNTSGSYSAAGLGAGAITLEAPGTATGRGNITVRNYLYALGSSSEAAGGGRGGTILVHADKTISAGGAYANGGSTSRGAGKAGDGGTIQVVSENGSVSLAMATTSGGYAGYSDSLGSGGGAGAGGSIHLKALGTGTDAGTVSVPDGLGADGGTSYAGAAGNGGSIRVEASRSVQIWGASVRGGSTYASLGSAGGGTGGSVIVSSGGSVSFGGSLSAAGGGGTLGGTGGLVDVQAATDLHVAEIDTTGGPGASSAGGGHGGSVALRFGARLEGGNVSADGGVAEPGSSTHPDGGAGGAGGSIAVTYSGAGTFTLQGQSFTAAGAAGGKAYASDPVVVGALGGRGGDGGTISVSSPSGALVLTTDPQNPVVSSLRAGAGPGGWNSDGTYAANGLPGQLNLAAGTDLALLAMTSDMLAGLSARAGGSLDVEMPIYTQGGAVTLGASSLTLAQPIDTTGAPRTFAATFAPRMATTSVGTTLANGDVLIAADSLDLQATVNAGSARALVQPLTSTRATRLGGIDDGTALNLSQDEINRITAGRLVIGDALNSGGIGVGSPIAIDPTLVSGLQLVTLGAIVQDPRAPLATPMLDAQGGSATLGVISAIGPVTVRSTGTLQLQDAISSHAMGDAVVLVAPHLQAASTASIAAPSGRALVYLDSHEGNDFGKLRSGNYALWGRTSAANPPGTIAETGNRYLFANQPAIDVTADAVTKVYDATPAFTLTYHSTSAVDASQFQNAFLQDATAVFTGSLAIANPGKNVGSYAITQGTLAANYPIRSFTGNTATITPAPLAITGISASDKVYDATTAATLAGVPVLVGLASTSDSVRASYSGARFADKNVGTGKAVTVLGWTLGGSDAGNYVLSSAPTALTASITPASVTVAGLVANNKVYDGTTAAITSGGKLAGVLGSDKVTLTPGSASFADKNVGKAKAVNIAGFALAGADAGNYVLAPIANLGADITPALLTLNGLSANNKVYDGATIATTSGGTLTGVLGSDSVSFTIGSASFADRNAGKGKTVSIAAAKLAGADAGNYTVGSIANLSADITPALLTLSGLSANNKVYDGTTAATTSGGALTGVLGSDNVRVTSGTASFADPNAGKAKPVAVQGIALAGADAGNYTLQAPPTLAADITQAPLTIQASNLSKEEGQAMVFAGTEFTPAKTGIGNEAITSVSLTSDGAAASAAAGAYPIKGWGASGSNGFVEGNYAITYLDGALAVFPATITQRLPAVVQVNNQVVTFATLFVQEASAQPTEQTTVQDLKDAKKKKDAGQDDLVVNTNVCK